MRLNNIGSQWRSQGFCVGGGHDGCPICICRQGLYREAHSPPITNTVHATNNVVEVVCDTTSPCCCSHLFLEITHFTMESAESIQRSLPRDAWVTSIDLVDTYFHIPIHRGYRKFLRFQTRDTIYQFRALPFGLSPASWVFSKIMTEIKCWYT